MKDFAEALASLWREYLDANPHNENPTIMDFITWVEDSIL